MLAKKPYLIIIKHFKFFNLILSIMIGYLIYNDNKMIKFFNQYIDINDTNVSMLDSVNTNLMLIIPIAVFFLSFVILSILVKKNKPLKLYFLVIFSFIAIIVINIYVTGFIETISKEIVVKRHIKLARDLKLISIILEFICCLPLFIRGIGLNLKKMNFSSEFSKIELEDDDSEDVEVSFNFNSDKIKKKRNKRKKELKYYYLENKLKVNTIIIILITVISISSYFLFTKLNKKNYGLENKLYTNRDFSIKINASYYSTKDYLGNKITDNYIIIINTTMKGENKILLNEFNLKVNDIIFKPVDTYYNYYVDLGEGYNEKISNEDKDYIIVFEIPKKYINKTIIFGISNISIKLNLINLDDIKVENYTFKLGDKYSFDDMYFTINDYDISEEYILDYQFCYKGINCINSKEYLKGSINENFDKVVLRLNVDANFDFYSYFNNFVKIVYKKNNREYYQNEHFELIKSKKTNIKDNYIYIGVDKNIMNSESIKLIFNKRNVKVDYILSGEL